MVTKIVCRYVVSTRVCVMLLDMMKLASIDQFQTRYDTKVTFFNDEVEPKKVITLYTKEIIVFYMCACVKSLSFNK